MSGCSVEDLIKTNRMMIAAMTGQSVDLTTDLPVTFSPTGLTPTLDARLEAIRAQAQSGQNTQHTDFNAANQHLEDIVEQLTRLADDANAEDIEERLTDIVNKISLVAAILGAIL